MKDLLVVAGASERDILKRIPLDEIDSVQPLQKLGELLLEETKKEPYYEEIHNGIARLTKSNGATMIVTKSHKTYFVPNGHPYAITFE